MTTAPAPPSIGVLAIQGDFAAHAVALRRLGARVREVRRAADLAGLDGLVLPGGESTAMLKQLEESGLDRAIVAFARGGGALLATCAGAILVARRVTNPEQRSLGLVDVEVQRNAYGRQNESFRTELTLDLAGPDGREAAVTMPGVFIRAPRVTAVGEEVEVLGRHGGEPVLVRQGRHLVATFHPELTGNDRVHAAFLALSTGEARAAPSPAPSGGDAHAVDAGGRS